MLGAAAQRIVHSIRKPRNNADEAIASKPGWDGACRAICFVATLSHRAYHWLRAASCISSRRASVATTRDLCRGSLVGDDLDTIEVRGQFTHAFARRFRVAARGGLLERGADVGDGLESPATSGALHAVPQTLDGLKVSAIQGVQHRDDFLSAVFQ